MKREKALVIPVKEKIVSTTESYRYAKGLLSIRKVLIHYNQIIINRRIEPAYRIYLLYLSTVGRGRGRGRGRSRRGSKMTT